MLATMPTHYFFAISLCCSLFYHEQVKRNASVQAYCGWLPTHPKPTCFCNEKKSMEKGTMEDPKSVTLYEIVSACLNSMLKETDKK